MFDPPGPVRLHPQSGWPQVALQRGLNVTTVFCHFNLPQQPERMKVMEKPKTVSPYRNPRAETLHAIDHMDLVWCLNKTAEIHGHFCPGSALGVMASVWGLRQLGNGIFDSEGMENLMAVVEINACFADGIQVISGCTLGNNALVYRDLGRMAVTFAVRGKKAGVRVRVRREFRAIIDRLVPEFYPLMERVIKNRENDPQREIAFKKRGKEAAFALLERPFEELLAAETVSPDLPEYAPITDSAICLRCGETVMATKMAERNKDLCRLCDDGEYGQMEGAGIVIKNRRDLPAANCHRHDHGREEGPGHRPSSFWMQDPQTVFASLSLQPADIFLDLGCGAGDFALAAAGRVSGGAVHALDRSKALIDTLKAETEFRGIGNVRATVADITDPLPLSDQSVDACILATVLHIPAVKDRAKDLFAEIRRVLKPQGRLAVMECKKEEMPFGPPLWMRLSAEDVEVLAEKCGFKANGRVDLGFNYMVRLRPIGA